MNLTINQRYFLGAAAVILATLAGTLVAYPQLPAIVPMHWNAHGQVDSWGPKWQLLVFAPGIMLGLVALFAALPWLSPKKFDVESFRPTYLYIMIVMVAMFAYIQILSLLAALGLALDIGRAAEGGISLFIALLGNVLGRVRRNFYVGIRTPWTIANERVWNVTHRLAAKTIFVGGLVGLIGVLLHAPFWMPIACFLVAAFVPAAYSLVFYKQMERRGELGNG
jgi:uncharacterized membrane protein